MNIKEKISLIIGVIIIIALLSIILGWSTNILTFVIKWGISIIIGIVTSGISGMIVESITNDWLKTITLTVEIKGFEFSISVFFIVTILIEQLLF